MFARFAVIGCLVLGALADQDESTWADTETTTKLWQLISSGDAEALGALIEDDASVAVARAADGRGPLWCDPRPPPPPGPANIPALSRPPTAGCRRDRGSGRTRILTRWLQVGVRGEE